MTTSRQRLTRSLAAAAVVGTMLPVAAAGPAQAGDSGDPAYSGFSTLATATPVHVEIYEPTIPIPANPQAELSFGYSTVQADTGSSRGRASYVWPGDAVGEGFKTIVENLGLPPELSGPIADGGYPDQVNSSSPSGEDTQADEPFPGMVMRTHASPDKTVASTGYSTDCQVDDAGAEGSGDGGGDGGTPGLPGLPPLPGLPVAQPPAAAAPAAQKQAKQSAEPDTSCQIPAELAALVDFGGYVSTSSSTNDGSTVAATSRAALSDIDLLGGVITISGVHVRSLATSNGEQAEPSGKAGYGTLAIAGQEFAIGPDGIEGGGQSQPIPGLPDDPAKALAQLGVQVTVPKPAYERDGDKATSTVAGLVVTLDTHQLRGMLDQVPFDEIVGAVPDQAGQLKSLLGAAVHLSPRFVITLGSATTVVDTVQGIDIPTTPPSTGGDGSTGTSGGSSGGGGTSVAPPSAAPPAAAPAGAAPATDGTLDDAAPAAAGLPPLYSLPGVLLFGGIGLAAAGGTYLRKIGLLALGGAGSCSHGLDSGLPDLRKA